MSPLARDIGVTLSATGDGPVIPIETLISCSPFYKWNFCDPKELPVKDEGGVAVLTGTKVGLLSRKVRLILLTLPMKSSCTYLFTPPISPPLPPPGHWTEP